MEVKENIITYEDGTKLEIFIDDIKKFSVNDRYRPDNTLSDSFNNCYKITKLMKMAYEAGKNGEEFSLTCENENEDDDEF